MRGQIASRRGENLEVGWGEPDTENEDKKEAQPTATSRAALA